MGWYWASAAVSAQGIFRFRAMAPADATRPGPATEAHVSRCVRGALLGPSPADRSKRARRGQFRQFVEGGEIEGFPAAGSAGLLHFCRQPRPAPDRLLLAQQQTAAWGLGTLLRVRGLAATRASSFWVVVSVCSGSGAARPRVDARVAPAPHQQIRSAPRWTGGSRSATELRRLLVAGPGMAIA